MFKMNEATVRLLSEDMCIDIFDLKKKMASKEVAPFSDQIGLAIDEFYSLRNKNNPVDEINKLFYSLEESVGEGEAAVVVDSLRHAFCSYVLGGLYNLFVCQENEQWYPKIILSSVLQPNEIDKLDEEFFIYRGCSRVEIKSKNYGQSWTTSLEVAKRFAFEHYSEQEWFDINDRIIIGTAFHRDGVLFSEQENEYEVTIDTSQLKEVEVVLESQE